MNIQELMKQAQKMQKEIKEKEKRTKYKKNSHFQDTELN